jgi:hypothetical protein
MAEAKGINPEIAPEVVKEELKEMATEVVEEVKEAAAEVVEKAPFVGSWEKTRPIVLFYTLYTMAAALLLALHLVVL